MRSQSVIFLLFILTNCFVNVTSEKVSISKSSLTIDKGSSDVIAFKLDNPIICEYVYDEICDVTILLTNPNTNKIKFDNCKIKWNSDEWQETRYLTVTAVENYVNDIPFDGNIITQPVISNSEYYNNFNPTDINVKTKLRPTATCSGTGDPHYTTFDGAYWHVYYPGNYVLYKSNVRDFEVQVSTRGYPSQHCGFAVRENNDIVVVYACDGSLKLRKNCGSPACINGEYPRIRVSGSSYQVEFASGAIVRIDYYNGVYGNVYVVAPGQDYMNTVGICGNFNGIASDDVPVYVASSQSQMPSAYIPKIDLFNWNPSTIIKENKSPYVEECTYVKPPKKFLILNNPDSEDITDLIKNSMKKIENTSNIIYQTEQPSVTKEDMYNLCEYAIKNTKTAEICARVIPDFDLNKYIDGCTDDMMFSNGNTDFIKITIEGMEYDCKSIASIDQTTWEKDSNGDPIQPNSEIQLNLCPNNCNNNGLCNMAKCVCNDGFKGVDCSIDISIPPTLHGLSEYNYDVKKLKNYPEEINVYGSNFWNSDKLKCKFGNITTNAFYMGSTQILCSIPKIILNDPNELVVDVSVTTDNINWSNYQNFTYYNSICNICNDNMCVKNEKSCIIDNVCRMENEHVDENVCKICNPIKSKTEWSYSYKSQTDCGINIPKTILTTKIIEFNKKNNIFYKINAVNPLTEDDKDNKLSYRLINSNSIFNITQNGELYTTSDLKVNEIVQPFNNLITYQITDNNENVAIGKIVVVLVENDISPLLLSEYIFNVDENSKKNTVIGIITANTSNTKYSMFSLDHDKDDIFKIDSETGEIKVNDCIDYENFNVYKYIVSVKNDNNIHMAYLTINVNNVNEPPYKIILDGDKINENMQIGTKIGILSSKDDEDTYFSYEINSTDFKIINNTLISNKTFNFEDQTKIPIKIKSYDSRGLYMEKEFIIYVQNVYETFNDINLSNTNVLENSKTGTVISRILFNNSENNDVYCKILNKSPFVVNDNYVILTKKLNYEFENEYDILIECTNHISSVKKMFIINIIDAEDYVEDLSYNIPSIYENINNIIIGNISGYVYNKDAKYCTFMSLDDRFELINVRYNKTNNYVYCYSDVYLTKSLDFETSSNIFTIKTITDKNITTDETIKINIGDVNEAPIGIQWITYNSIQEYSKENTIVGYFVVIDPDKVNDHKITSSDTTFKINKINNKFMVSVDNPENIRYDLHNYIEIPVMINDGQYNLSTILNITILDVPTKIWLDNVGNRYIMLKENTTVNSVVAKLVFENIDSSFESPVLKSEYFKLVNNSIILIKTLDYETLQYIEFVIDNTVFTVLIENINEKPFALNNTYYTNIAIDIDVGEIVELVPNLIAYDPDGDKIVYSISNNEYNIFKINPVNGQLMIQIVPSSTNIKLGKHILKIGLSDGVNYFESPVTYEITKCKNCKLEFESENDTGGMEDYIIVIIVGSAMLAIIVLTISVVIYQRNKKDPIPVINYSEEFINPMMYKPPEPIGFSNGLYDWYKPNFTKTDTENYLSNRQDGTFIVRETNVMPCWHMFSIKENGQILHKEIKQTPENLYTLIDDKNKLLFPDIASLVNYYTYDSVVYDNINIKNTIINDTYDTNYCVDTTI